MSKHGKIAADKTHLGVNIPKDLKAELRRLAKSDNRTLSNYVVTELQRIVSQAPTPTTPMSTPPVKDRIAELRARTDELEAELKQAKRP